jgi:NADPH-dependent 2,4-dienoyl-CoA reductase/sulfur reductase-like enzyme
MPTRALPTACVIGAGSSGIAAAKKLNDAGIPFDCFEKSDRVGGNWVFGNRNGMSSAYRSLHINTSRDRMEYADFPMPRDYPDFPHHTQIAAYFDSYVDHFGFRDRITFGTGVESATRGTDGTWHVTLDSGETRRYDALLVANGHHWDPRWPEPAFPGDFDGVQMHAHHYVDNADMRDKRVVVLGMGNSAMDIAVEASQVAGKVFLAARRGAHVIPKYLFGRPLDQMGLSPRVPWAIRQKVLEAIIKATTGDMERYGLPKPDHRIGDAHPTISSEILSRLYHGEITPKPNIARLEGDSIRFADGSVERADVVVYCTGYKVTFPFFDEDFLSAPDNDLPLFRRVFHPDIRTVFFIGLLQPLGAIMPLAEAQGAWVGEYLRGDYALPPTPELRHDIERERRRMFKRYVASKRHTMQVDYDDYLLDLQKELRRGRERASRAGRPLPVPARAAADDPVTA